MQVDGRTGRRHIGRHRKKERDMIKKILGTSKIALLSDQIILFHFNNNSSDY